MSVYFFDSSAIVKRYYQEPGSNWVRAICGKRIRPLLFLSQLAQVEVVASLFKTGRIQGKHPSFIQSAVNRFNTDAAHRMYHITLVDPETVAVAAELCRIYSKVDPGPLRSLDAIQLAGASLLAASIDDDMLFVTADSVLGRVAEGLVVVNPLSPPAV